MAKKSQVFIDVVVDDKGTTKRVAVNAKKLGLELDNAGVGADKAARGTEKLSNSSRNASRNMQGLSKRTSNGAKEFSKMQQGMGGLVGAYATLAAQVFAVSAAFQFLSEAAQLKNLIAGQEALGAVTGTTYKTITNSIVEATEAQLKYGEAARAAAIGTAAGLTAGQLTELGTAAKNVSFALGRDLTDSFNRLVRGVTKAEPELLDELGIILRLDPAIKKYKEALGIVGRELTAFERSQAVTNEVLEQATRKFAKIEALMDPNAAALARFTKSFDTLVNQFKIGLITGLTPALEFLSENTKALIATLTLFSLPILRAILPSFDKWQEKTKSLAAASKKAGERQLQLMEKQAEKTRAYYKGQVQMAEEAAIKTKNIAKKHGIGADSSMGMQALYGEGEMSGRERAAAGKMLAHAEGQLQDENLQKRTGALRKHSAEEVAILRSSYDKRVALASKTSKSITHLFQMSASAIITTYRGAAGGVATIFAGMVSIARGAAIAINVAMSTVAIVGVLVLVWEAFKKVKDIIDPVSEKLKNQQKDVENLSKKYQTLTEEIERNRQARIDLLRGDEAAMNVGATLQGIDVKQYIADVREFQAMDRSVAPEEYDKTALRLKEVAGQLILVDKRFRDVGLSLVKGTTISKDSEKDLVNLANRYIKIGATLRSLPELAEKARTSFTNLTKSLTKGTAIDQFVVDQTAQFRGTEEQQNQLELSFANRKKEVELAEALLQKQKEEAKAVGMTIDELDELNKKRQSSLKRKKQEAIDEMKRKGITDIRGEVGFRDEDTIKRIKEQREEDRKGIEAISKAKTKDSLLMLRSISAQQEMNDLQDDRLDNTLRQAEQTTLGLTLAGKLKNVTVSTISAENAVLKAKEKQVLAQFAYDNETGQAKVNAEKHLNIVKKEVRVAEAKRDLAVETARLQKEELQRQIALLQVKMQQLMLTGQIAAANQQAATVEAMGGGSFESKRQARELRTGALEDGVTLAQSRADEEAAAYVQRYQDRIKSLAEQRGGLENLTDADRLDIAVSADPAKLQGAQQQLQIAKDNLAIMKEGGAIMVKEQQFESEKLGMRAQSNFFDRGEQLFLDMKMAALDKGIQLSDQELVNLRAQADAQVALNDIIEMKAGLADSITSNMESAFVSIIDGSKSAKEAFASMAKAILADIAKMIVKLLVQRAIMAAMGMADGGISPTLSQAPTVGIGNTMAAKSGGVFGPLKKNSYTSGGIARGPHAGYAATLHGNEAVVPLPHNRKIPVELMGGAGGQQNNVTVNVNMTGGGGTASQAGQGDSNQANQIGDAIAKAVQAELQYQKRSGGILNPYGVA